MKEKRNLYLKILVIIAVIACLGILQVAAIKALPYPFDSLNLIIISLVFVLLLSSWHTALWWSFGLGLLLDLYSFAPFGINLISLALALLAINFLLANVFTNRSLYSVLVLTSTAYFVYELCYYALASGLTFLAAVALPTVFNLDFFSGELYGLILNLVFSILIFYFLNFASRRYKLPF